MLPVDPRGVLGGVSLCFFRVNTFECILIVGLDHLVLLRRLRTLPRKTRNRRIGQPRKGLIHHSGRFPDRETGSDWEVFVLGDGIGLDVLICLGCFDQFGDGRMLGSTIIFLYNFTCRL